MLLYLALGVGFVRLRNDFAPYPGNVSCFQVCRFILQLRTVGPYTGSRPLEICFQLKQPLLVLNLQFFCFSLPYFVLFSPFEELLAALLFKLSQEKLVTCLFSRRARF